MHYLVGIDDTDNLESRGTGYRSRQMAALIIQAGIGDVTGITRHQHLRVDEIPYTSQNSSACLEVFTDKHDALVALCRDYLIKESAPGSDTGLCIVEWENICENVVDFGLESKARVLSLAVASQLAKSKNIFLEGLTGTHCGMIGALAATGLRKSGNDGRFVWLKGEKSLRELSNLVLTAGDVKRIINIRAVETLDQGKVMDSGIINLTDWVRPVLKNGKSTLLVKKINSSSNEYETFDKEYIRSIS